MNADKTDTSNTNRTRNQTSGTILPGKTKGVQLESQSAGDPQAEKQRSARRQKIGDITKSLSDGSTNIPTGVQKVTTGNNGHKDKSVGEWDKSQNICRGTRAHCMGKNCHEGNSAITPLGNNPQRENRSST
jgi:hypothetical protein